MTPEKLAARVSEVLGRNVFGERTEQPILDLCDKVEKLQKALAEIAEAEPLSIAHDIGYMQHVARKVLEGME